MKESVKEYEVISRIDGNGRLFRCEVCYYCRYFNIETKLCNIYNERLEHVLSAYSSPDSHVIEIENYISYQCSYWEERDE